VIVHPDLQKHAPTETEIAANKEVKQQQSTST